MKKSLLALAMLSSFSSVWADEWDVRLNISIYSTGGEGHESHGPNYNDNFQSLQSVACFRPQMDKKGGAQPENFSISKLTDLFKSQTADIRTALTTEYQMKILPNGMKVRTKVPSEEFKGDVEPLVIRLAAQASGVETAYDKVQREQAEFSAAVEARRDGARVLDEAAERAERRAEELAREFPTKEHDLRNLIDTMRGLLAQEYAENYSWTDADNADDRLIVRFIKETNGEIERLRQEVGTASQIAVEKRQEANRYDRSPSRVQLEAAISGLKGAVVSTRDELRTLVKMVENRPKVREDMSLENIEDIRPEHRDDNKVKNDTKCLINVTEEMTEEVLKLH